MAITAPKETLVSSLQKDIKEADQRLIKLARSRFTTASTNWSDIRRLSVQDQQFYTSEQYDSSGFRALRARGGAPQITINMLPNFVQQIENNIRQQNIGINVHATDAKGTEETATVLQGLVRHIEHNSNAKQAYLWAAGSHGALVPGFGFIKLETDYVEQNGEPTFDQEIYIRGVKDPMTILPDFNAQMPDFSDAEYWFEFEVMDKDEYKEKYSESKLNDPTYGNWNGMSQTIGMSWIKASQVTVAKYWYKDTAIRHFGVFEDGTTGYLDEFGVEIDAEGKTKIVDADLNPKIELTEDEQEEIQAAFDAKAVPGGPASEYPVTERMVPVDRLAKLTRWREVVTHKVMNIITNGLEILAGPYEWNDSEFPFVGVVGVDRVIDGKRDIHGIIRYAKEPQKMYNFMTSQMVRKIDASNKAPWIASGESIPEPQRKAWELSNFDNRAILYYKAYDDSGKPLPPPTRGDAVEPAIQGLLAAGQKFNQDIKATVGIYEAGIGQAMGDRQSGSAIQTLAQNGETSNYHFSDNLVLSMKRLGCLILRLIPKIYDTARTIRIVGLDDEEDLVKINQMFTHNGQDKKYDIKNCGGYDVVIDTGPTFASKKAQQSESMLKFAAVEPQLMPVIADILAGNMDWDTAGTIKDRIQLFQSQTMPWIHAGQGQPQMDPKTKVMFQQLQQQLTVANQHVTTLTQAYQQEHQKVVNQVASHEAKTQQIYMKEVFALQKQRNELIAERQNTQDKLVLAHTKVQLDHIDTRFGHIMALYDATRQVDDTATSSIAATAQPAASPAPSAALPAPSAALPAPAAQPNGSAGAGGPIVSQ